MGQEYRKESEQADRVEEAAGRQRRSGLGKSVRGRKEKGALGSYLELISTSDSDET